MNLGPCYSSVMELFANFVNGGQQLAVLQGSKYTSVMIILKLVYIMTKSQIDVIIIRDNNSIQYIRIPEIRWYELFKISVFNWVMKPTFSHTGSLFSIIGGLTNSKVPKFVKKNCTDILALYSAGLFCGGSDITISLNSSNDIFRFCSSLKIKVKLSVAWCNQIFSTRKLNINFF